jgi:hypothetical protein
MSTNYETATDSVVIKCTSKPNKSMLKGPFIGLHYWSEEEQDKSH